MNFSSEPELLCYYTEKWLIRNDPLTNHSLAVHIIDAVLGQMPEIYRNKAFDIVLCGSATIKAGVV